MKYNISVPAFVFKLESANEVTNENIVRQDEEIESEFPVFQKQEVLDIAEQLTLQNALPITGQLMI